MQQPLATELDDVSLAHARRGEARACRRLIELYQRPVFALLSRMLVRSDRVLVEDLAQETFLRVFRALPGFDPHGPARLSTWILTIATRLALDELARRRPTTVPLEDALHLPQESGLDEVERKRLRGAIVRALEQLSPEQRAVFVLREHHDLDYEEIARSLELDLNTVKSRLFRARTALRAALSEVRV